MAMDPTPHSGILFRGATGQLWYMLDTDAKPTELADDVKLQLAGKIGDFEPEPYAATELSEEISRFICELLGIPFIGHWWVWGPFTAR
ncbi:MAG TPA: hypothetical protein VI384_02585 [Candidatus Dormibacteraeota bacterium]